VRQHTGQFGSFDGLDNRKELMRLFSIIGKDKSAKDAAIERAMVLQGFLDGSETGFAGKPIKVTPCGVTEAYFLFTAITGCLGVPVEAAAKRLDWLVRRRG
jgi:hypothetical protein